MDVDKSQWVSSVMSQFEQRLLRYTGRFVTQPSAQEIVQETFLRLWEQDPNQLDGRLAPWLFTVCRNQAIDRCRKESRALEISLQPSGLTPEEQTSNNQQKSSLNALVSHLKPEQQEVIRLKFEEDMSYKEISAITGHSVSYVGVLIHEAMTQLRKHYE